VPQFCRFPFELAVQRSEDLAFHVVTIQSPVISEQRRPNAVEQGQKVFVPSDSAAACVEVRNPDRILITVGKASALKVILYESLD
jgi:hypothetical protein